MHSKKKHVTAFQSLTIKVF